MEPAPSSFDRYPGKQESAIEAKLVRTKEQAAAVRGGLPGLPTGIGVPEGRKKSKGADWPIGTGIPLNGSF